MSVSLPETPPSSPPSLTSLPREILSLIALHLNHADALSLRYTHSCFGEVTEKPLWRELDLTLPLWYSALPLTGLGYGDLVVPFDTDEYREWELKEGELARERYSARLREKVKSMVTMSTHRRWGMAESVKLAGRPDVARGYLTVLDCVASTLRVLDVEAPPFYIADRINTHRDYQYLDYYMITLHCRMAFPSLTHIRLAPGSFHYIEFLILLCNSAPNLYYLSADLDGVIYNDEDNEIFRMPDYARSYQGETSVRHLHISASPTYLLVDLLNASPRLERVRLHCPDADLYEVVSVLGRREHLRELCCEGADLWDFTGYGKLAFSCLGVLEVELDGRLDIFRLLPEFSHVHTLRLKLRTPESPSHLGITEASLPVVMQDMIPVFAAGLRSMPELQCIRIAHASSRLVDEDTADGFTSFGVSSSAGDLHGVFRSIRFGASELLQARLLLGMEEVTNTAYDFLQGSEGPFDHLLELVYVTKEGVRRKKTFIDTPSSVWHHFSDYNGSAVPLEVISRMAEVEGLGEEWQGRGVQVGEAAWKVLTDWEKERLAVV